ncbi:hypothetical protein D3C72_1924230 [compost metagenome]
MAALKVGEPVTGRHFGRGADVLVEVDTATRREHMQLGVVRGDPVLDALWPAAEGHDAMVPLCLHGCVHVEGRIQCVGQAIPVIALAVIGVSGIDADLPVAFFHRRREHRQSR